MLTTILASIITTILTATVSAIYTLSQYYKERKRALREDAYKEYVVASQELAAHLTEPDELPTYQRAYFQACAKVYLCGSVEVLKALNKRHSNLQNTPMSEQQEYFNSIVETMRKDLDMGKANKISFPLIVVKSNRK